MLPLLKKILQSLPFRLLFCIIIAFLSAHHLGDNIVRIFFTISCVFKEIIMFILPIMIFGYIFSAIISLEKNAPLLILVILGLVTISNAVSSFTSYTVAVEFLPYITIIKNLDVTLSNIITPFFSINLGQIISSDKAMFSGTVLGIFFCYFKQPRISHYSAKLQNLITAFLEKCFIPILPLYIFGFVLKMHREGELELLFTNYAQVFIVICTLIIIYIFLMYFIASGLSLNKCNNSIKEMSIAGITGFSTISSAASMPVTIKATEKNISNGPFAKLIIPATVNIHMIGHGLSIPITSLTILMIYGQPLPSLATFISFVIYFCIAKFSATAVPGGGIIVILPILHSQLGFTPEMSSIIIMLDILQDAILTSANVMGNGAFAIIAHKICKKLKLT